MKDADRIKELEQALAQCITPFQVNKLRKDYLLQRISSINTIARTALKAKLVLDCRGPVKQ